MDKQTMFEAMMYSIMEEIEAPTDQSGINPGDLATTYILGYVLAVLRPAWYHNDKHDAAYRELLSKISKYLDRAPDASKYPAIAYSGGFSLAECSDDTLGTKGGPQVHLWRGMIDPANLGLCFSNNAKDKRFIRQAILQYLKRGFSNASVSMSACRNRQKKELTDKLTVLLPAVGSSASSSSGLSPCIPSPFLFPKINGTIRADIETECLSEQRLLNYEMSRYAMMLLGEVEFFRHIPTDQRWKYIEREDGSKIIDPNSVWARDAACLRPITDACSGCQPEFREFLSTLYYVYASGLPLEPLTKRNNPEKDRYFHLGRQVILPLVNDAFDIDHQRALEGGKLALASIQHQQEMEKAQEELTELREALKQNTNNAACIEAEKSELEATKQELEQMRKLANASAEEVEQLKELISSLERERDALTAALSESKLQYNNLNEQLIDLIEDNDDFLDDEPLLVEENQASSAGIRAKIGEESYQKLAGKRLAIVGGHENTCSALRALFPDWKFFLTDTLIPDTLSSVDAIAVITSYVSHKSYQQAKIVSKNKGIQLILVAHNGPTTICRTLAAQVPSKLV